MKKNNQNAGTHPPDIFGAAAGMGIAGKQDELEALAASNEGKRVAELLGGEDAVAKMAESGDMDGLKSALSSIVKTDEGAELLRRLSEIMNKA